MSKGPGKIERAIAALFVAEPDDAFNVEDMADRVLPGINRLEKKHRVTLIRAAKRVCERMDGWQWSTSEGHGGALVFWHRYSVRSYATMRAKTDMFACYRSHDPRRRGLDHLIATPASIAASLEPGGRYHHHVTEGGAWWRHVQLWIAERDDDASERTQALQAEQDEARRQIAQWSGTLDKVLAARAR